MIKKIKRILIGLLPLFIMLFIILTNLLNHQEATLTILVILVIASTFLIKYETKEIYLFGFGIFVGAVIESISNYFLGQSWAYAAFKIPLWLFLAWGYAFVMIRRAGNIIVNGHNAGDRHKGLWELIKKYKN